MLKSASTTTYNMQKSALNQNQSGLKTVRSTLPNQSTKFTKQNDNTVQQNPSKLNEDQYVEKLHEHITFLESEINKAKTKQSEYKQGMMGIMNKDTRPIVDHAVDSTGKYKQMKQELVQIFNTKDQEKIILASEVIGLANLKEYLEKNLNETEIRHENTSKVQTDAIIKLKEQLMKEKEKHSISQIELDKWKSQHEKIIQTFEKQERETNEKKLVEKIEQERYDQDRELYLKDLEEKKKEIALLNEQLRKLNGQQNDDVRYKELQTKNGELREELNNTEIERELSNYSNKELEQRVKLGTEQKELLADDKRRLKLELDKHLEIKAEIIKRNQQKVEQKVQNSDSAEMREKQKELKIVEKEAKDLQQKFLQVDDSYKKFSIEMMNKNNQYNSIKAYNEEQNKKLQAEAVNFNNLKAAFDEKMQDIETLRERYASLLKEKDRLQIETRKLEEQQSYLSKKFENLEQNINLDDELQKKKIEDLKNTTDANTRFNSMIGELSKNWEEMRKFAKNRQL